MAGLECNTFGFSFFCQKILLLFILAQIFFLSELIQSLKGGKFPRLKKIV